MSSINVNVWGKVVLELLSMIYHNENWLRCLTICMNNNHPITFKTVKYYGMVNKNLNMFEHNFKYDWNVIENWYHSKLRSCYCCTFSKLIRVIKTSLIFCEWRCRFYITCSILDQIQYVGCYLISKTGQWNN